MTSDDTTRARQVSLAIIIAAVVAANVFDSTLILIASWAAAGMGVLGLIGSLPAPVSTADQQKEEMSEEE